MCECGWQALLENVCGTPVSHQHPVGPVTHHRVRVQGLSLPCTCCPLLAPCCNLALRTWYPPDSHSARQVFLFKRRGALGNFIKMLVSLNAKYKAFNFILNFLEKLGEMYWLRALQWEMHLPRGRAVCQFSKPFPSEVVHRALKCLEKRHQPKTPGPALSALSLTHYENPLHLLVIWIWRVAMGKCLLFRLHRGDCLEHRIHFS